MVALKKYEVEQDGKKERKKGRKEAACAWVMCTSASASALSRSLVLVNPVGV